MLMLNVEERRHNVEDIKKKGEYLGYCPQKKGWLYSVDNGVGVRGYQEYTILYISEGQVYNLISYTANREV